jgi:hypothetical protein
MPNQNLDGSQKPARNVLSLAAMSLTSTKSTSLGLSKSTRPSTTVFRIRNTELRVRIINILSKIQRNVSLFNILLQVGTIFFSMATKMSKLDPDPAGSEINLPPCFGSERNIYGSRTLLYTVLLFLRKEH